ncbi:MAG: cytochrome c peroxidase [Marinoscillum sp.]
MKNLLPLLMLAALFTIVGCSTMNDDDIPQVRLTLDPTEIKEEFTLGRVLFYDQSLSVNNSVSCASCHKQAFAFADNVAFSSGFENRVTTRNSMPLQNLGNSGGIFDDRLALDFNGNVGVFFWDGRESNLSTMVLKPIVNHREMGIQDVDALVERIANLDYYKKGFRNVYNDDQIDIQRVGRSLAAFVGSITSTDTKLDQVSRGERQFTELERLGQQLFVGKYECNSCHQVQSPSGYLFAGTFSNIGLDPVYEDDGLGLTTNREEDKGKFKIPSLRNVELTAPYMHDGRFQTLEEVIDHYSTGLTDNENLDFRLRENFNGDPKFFDITNQERKAIVEFLHTLTDYTMISDPNLSNPFRSIN